jgi:hypothetical protein
LTLGSPEEIVKDDTRHWIGSRSTAFDMDEFLVVILIQKLAIRLAKRLPFVGGLGSGQPHGCGMRRHIFNTIPIVGHCKVL